MRPIVSITGSPPVVPIAARVRRRTLVQVSVLGGLVILVLSVLAVPTATDDAPVLGPNLLSNGGFEEPAISPRPGMAGYSSEPLRASSAIPFWNLLTGKPSSPVYLSTAIATPFGVNNAHVAPQEGEQFIGLKPFVGDDFYRIDQAFATEVGKTYQVSYYIGGSPAVNEDGRLSDSTAAVAVTERAQGCGGDPSTVGWCTYQDGSGDYPLSWNGWQRHSFTFVARTESGSVSLEGKTTSLFGLPAPGDPPMLDTLPYFDGVSINEILPPVVDTPIVSAPVVFVAVALIGVTLVVARVRRRSVRRSPPLTPNALIRPSPPNALPGGLVSLVMKPRARRAVAVAAVTASLVIVVATPAMAVDGPNLVVEGGFEGYQPFRQLGNKPLDLPLDPWYLDAGTTTNVLYSVSDVRVGPADTGQQYFVAQQYNSGGSSYVLSQDLLTTPGDSYVVSFATKSLQPQAGAGSSATVQVRSGATVLKSLTVVPPSTWQTYTYSFTASAATTTISLSSSVATSTISHASYDSIVVQRISVEDVPLGSPIVALTFVGVGLGVAAGTVLVVARRRRQRV